MSKGTSAAVDELRDFHPNTRVTVTLSGRRFGTQVDARAIVRDFDAAVADRDYWKKQAAAWERIAMALDGKLPS